MEIPIFWALTVFCHYVSGLGWGVFPDMVLAEGFRAGISSGFEATGSPVVLVRRIVRGVFANVDFRFVNRD